MSGQYLGQVVRGLVGEHMTTILLTDYDEVTDSYSGEGHRNITASGLETLPVVTSVHGFRRYPYEARPDYAFQFVLIGEDEQPLRDLAGQPTGSIPTFTPDQLPPVPHKKKH